MKKVFDKISTVIIVASMDMFNMKFRKETYGGFKFVSWLMFMHDDSERRAPISLVGCVYVSLFYATLLTFLITMTWCAGFCETLPIADDITKGHYIECIGSNLVYTKTCDNAFDLDSDVIINSQLIGVIDPTKEYQTLFGFSSSYPNYIKSTSYKFA